MKLRLLYILSIIETVSWMTLLSGMTLKYGFDNEALMQFAGMFHGMSFVLFVGTALLCHLEYRWSLRRTVTVIAAAIPPFVGFWYVHGLIEREGSASAGNAARA